MIARKTALALSLTFAFTACSGDAAPAKKTTKKAEEPKAASTPAEHAEEIYGTYCTTCHGATGTGDGIAAATLEPKPRSFSDKKWQDSVTDEHLETVIMKGGEAVKLSPSMAAAASWFKGKPEGTLKAMIAKIRGMAK